MTPITGALKPVITMTQSNYETLSRLAESWASKDRDVSEHLFTELDRARVVEDIRIPNDVVQIGSTVRFTTNTGETRTVLLVFPGEADIALGKVSVMTPIGAALIGLSPSQSIEWIARDGRTHKLTVEHVEKMDAVLPERPHAEVLAA
ncbi:nucleoside diphosphate kinase regulator [Shinella zoogloeoides]|jgi:regulator of nucleoside diphosphate kinase